MRYIFYDKETGRILHTLQVFKLGSDDPQEPNEDDIRAVLQRFPDPERIELTRTDLPRASSRQLSRTVDVRTGKLVTMPLVTDRLTERLQKITSGRE